MYLLVRKIIYYISKKTFSWNKKQKIQIELHEIFFWKIPFWKCVFTEFFLFFFIGGVEDLEQLPAPQFRYGLIGCISELSIGKLFAIDLLNRAKNGQNVDKCRETFDF